MLFTSPGFTWFNWHSCTVASFEGSYYNCLWSGNEGTWHRVISLAQHCWPGLWRYIYCFGSVRRSLYGGRKYTHTQTHTHTHTHTHTQTCMHTRTHVRSIFTFKSQNWWRIFTLHFYPTCPRFLSKLDMASETLSLTELNLYKTSR